MTLKDIRAFETSIGKNNPKYGKKTKAYPKKAANVCFFIADKIALSIESGACLKELFLQLLPIVGDKRRQIAFEMSSESINDFGLLRTELCNAYGLITPLKNEYQKTSDAIYDFVRRKESGKEEDIFSKVTLQKMSRFETIQKGYFTRRGKILKGFVGESKMVLGNSLYSIAVQVDEKSKKVRGTSYREIREKEGADFEVYKANALSSLFKTYQPWDQYALIEVEIPYQNQWLNAAHILIGYDEKSHGFALLRHADQMGQQSYHALLSELFEQTLQSDEGFFFCHLAHFEYVFSFATPYVRGSASIREFFARAILHYRLYRQVPYKKGTTMDLIAFQTPLFSEFERIYKDNYATPF